MNSDDYSDAEIDLYIADLVSQGGIELIVDENGNTFFSITDKTKELAPDLYDLIVEELNETVLELYNKGLVNIEYNEELEPLFSLTEYGKDIVTTLMEDTDARPDSDPEAGSWRQG